MDESSTIDSFVDIMENMILEIEDSLTSEEIYDTIRESANNLYEELQLLQRG